MSLLQIHGRLATTAMLFALALGVWALFLYFRKQGPSPNFHGALVIGELVFIVQAVLGGVLYFTGLPLGQAVHVLYGALGVFTIPAAYTYTRGATTRREAGIYGIACLFLFGVALRGIMTAH
jgi:heme A synthase